MLFPAQAGVIPDYWGGGYTWVAFPRASGGDPAQPRAFAPVFICEKRLRRDDKAIHKIEREGIRGNGQAA